MEETHAQLSAFTSVPRMTSFDDRLEVIIVTFRTFYWNGKTIVRKLEFSGADSIKELNAKKIIFILSLRIMLSNQNVITLKPNQCTMNTLGIPKIVAAIDRWSLFRGSFVLQKLKTGSYQSGRFRLVKTLLRWS